jgi:signal peptidase
MFEPFISQLRTIRKRELALRLLSVVMIGTSALMMWGGLKFITSTTAPVVVVLSESMSPGFHRGDLLFLHQWSTEQPLDIGDIVVYNLRGHAVPIVHRILTTHEDRDTGETLYLTKGDANPGFDVGLYPGGQQYITRDDIVGPVRAFFPYLGYATILMTDLPWLKYALFAGLGLLTLLGEDN